MSESKRDQIKKAVIESALSSSIIGIPNIFRNDKILLKIIWTLSLLSSSCYCFYTMVASINSYYNWNVVTNIKVIHEIPTEFPAITLCNLNPLVTDYALSLIHNLSIKNEKYLNLNNVEYFSTNASLLKFSALLSTMGKNYTDEDRKRFSLPLKDFIVECTFGVSSKCDLDDFDWHYNFYYGNCYTFNNGRNLNGKISNIYNSTQPGFNNGLRLKLFLGDPSKTHKIFQSYGVHVYVHNKSSKPRYEEGVDVSSGEKTHVVINRIFENNLEFPYTNCISDQNKLNSFKFYRAITRSNRIYTQKECFDMCLQNEIIKSCNCSVPFFISESKNCDSITDTRCAIDATDLFFKELNIKCSHLCPRECETISYTLSTSHSDFPSLSYGQFLRNQTSVKERFKNYQQNSSRKDSEILKEIDMYEFKTGIAAINIYYEDLKYTKISQIEEMNFPDLLSNLGGTLGLFVGFSVLSFVEILEVILHVMTILVNIDTKVRNKSATKM